MVVVFTVVSAVDGVAPFTNPAVARSFEAFAASPLMSVPFCTSITMSLAGIVKAELFVITFGVGATGTSSLMRCQSFGASSGSHKTAPATPSFA